MNQRITVGHSPDPDDAFMFHGIACGKVDTAGFEIHQLLEDIESLNRRCMESRIEVSAVSIHAYAHLTRTYALMHCGASMGDGYGPRIVTRQPVSPDELTRMTIAVPGTLTSAFLALQLYLGEPFEYRVVPFDRILEAGKISARADATASRADAETSAASATSADAGRTGRKGSIAGTARYSGADCRLSPGSRQGANGLRASHGAGRCRAVRRRAGGS